MRPSVIALSSAAAALAVGSAAFVWVETSPRDAQISQPTHTAGDGEAPETAAPTPTASAGAPTTPSGRTSMWGRSADQARLFWLDDPHGDGPEIALRFLTALQRHDHWSAAAQLGLVGRAYFANHEASELTRVMSDVYRHAELGFAGPCTSAQPLNPEAVSVSCGSRTVVVHVSDGLTGRGVLLSPQHEHNDRYLGPHTHAAMTVDLR